MARPPCRRCYGSGKFRMIVFKGYDSNGDPLFEFEEHFCDCRTHS